MNRDDFREALLAVMERRRTGHRTAAWRVILDHTGEDTRDDVVAAMEDQVEAWLAYRDGVATACGITR